MKKKVVRMGIELCGGLRKSVGIEGKGEETPIVLFIYWRLATGDCTAQRRSPGLGISPLSDWRSSCSSYSTLTDKLSIKRECLAGEMISQRVGTKGRWYRFAWLIQ